VVWRFSPVVADSGPPETSRPDRAPTRTQPIITTFDKAIAGFLSALFVLLVQYFPGLGAHAATFEHVAPIIVGAVVWLVPNKRTG
jgi:hypothetical protein